MIPLRITLKGFMSYRDEATVTDANLVTGRGADDLPQFCQALVALLNVRA